jgi:hypothetical protein
LLIAEFPQDELPELHRHAVRQACRLWRLVLSHHPDPSSSFRCVLRQPLINGGL